MKALIGNENERVIWFGKRHRVAVRFTRANGLWHAHAGLLPEPVRSIRDARARVARELRIMATPEGHWGATNRP
jgi:hypothetical protein